MPFWLTANEQTEGTGRMNRHWVSKPGNLYATHLTFPPDTDALPLLPFALSLAIHEIVTAHLPAAKRSDVVLKWPNDVLVGQAKISGVRVEQKTQGAGATLMAIGIGINVDHSPQIEDRAVTSLAEQGAHVAVGDVFETLRDAVAKMLNQLTNSPQSIIPAWSQKAIGLGGPLTIDLGQEIVTGTFDHLASDGALMVRLASGAMRAIRTGDVVIKPQ